MANKILFAPRRSQEILDIVRSLTPAGFELAVVDFGTPEFYQAAADAEYFMGLARQMGGGSPVVQAAERDLDAAFRRTDVGELDIALPEWLRQHPARRCRRPAEVGDSGAGVVTRLSTRHVLKGGVGRGARSPSEHR